MAVRRLSVPLRQLQPCCKRITVRSDAQAPYFEGLFPPASLEPARQASEATRETSSDVYGRIGTSSSCRGYLSPNSIGLRDSGATYLSTSSSAGASGSGRIPTEIRMRKAEKSLLLTYSDGSSVSLPAELLRFKSLSSENKRVDAQGNPRVVAGRRHLGIMRVDLVGQYGIRIFFDDLHDSGIFSYSYLDELGRHKYSYAKQYIQELRMRGYCRDPPQRTRKR